VGIERSYKIVQNRGERSNKIDLPALFCVSLVFLWHLEAFQSDSSGFAVNMTLRNSVLFIRVCMGI